MAIVIGFGYGLLKDAASWAVRRFGRPDPAKVVAIRRRWKQEIETHRHPADPFRLQLGTNIIIRDISRMDLYPKVNPVRRGISPWFKVEYKDTYHRGIEVILRVEGMRRDSPKGRWRVADINEESQFNGWVIGRIPFERIREIDWDGDENYTVPHIYCAFTGWRKEPYEEVVVMAKHGESEDLSFFTEVTDYRSAWRGLLTKRSRWWRIVNRFRKGPTTKEE